MSLMSCETNRAWLLALGLTAMSRVLRMPTILSTNCSLRMKWAPNRFLSSLSSACSSMATLSMIPFCEHSDLKAEMKAIAALIFSPAASRMSALTNSMEMRISLYMSSSSSCFSCWKSLRQSLKRPSNSSISGRVRKRWRRSLMLAGLMKLSMYCFFPTSKMLRLQLSFMFWLALWIFSWSIAQNRENSRKPRSRTNLRRSSRTSSSALRQKGSRQSTKLEKYSEQAFMFSVKLPSWSLTLLAMLQMLNMALIPPTRLVPYSTLMVRATSSSELYLSLVARKPAISFSKMEERLKMMSRDIFQLWLMPSMNWFQLERNLFMAALRMCEQLVYELILSSMAASRSFCCALLSRAQSRLKGMLISCLPSCASLYLSAKQLQPSLSLKRSMNLHGGAGSSFLALRKGSTLLEGMMESMIQMMVSLLSEMSASSLSCSEMLRIMSKCLVGCSERVTTTDSEERNRFLISPSKYWQLNIFTKPLKVLMMPSPLGSTNFSSSNTSTNFTLSACSKTALRKQETPMAPMQFLRSSQPAMSMSVVSSSRWQMLGARVTEVRVLPSAAFSLLPSTTTQK